MIRNASKPCSVPKPRPAISQGQAECGHRCPSTPCTQATYTMYVRGGLFPKGSFLISGHIYCPLGDGLDPDLAHMEIKGAVSALCGWGGEGVFGQKKAALELD